MKHFEKRTSLMEVNYIVNWGSLRFKVVASPSKGSSIRLLKVIIPGWQFRVVELEAIWQSRRSLTCTSNNWSWSIDLQRRNVSGCDENQFFIWEFDDIFWTSVLVIKTSIFELMEANFDSELREYQRWYSRSLPPLVSHGEKQEKISCIHASVKFYGKKLHS